MSWNASFGDALSVEEVIDRINRASRHQVSKFYPPTDEKYDDLVQEGTVAGVKAAAKAQGNPVTYGTVAARRRINDVAVKGSPMLGSEGSGGPTYDPLRKPGLRESEQALDDLLLAAPDLLEAVEWSYHRGLILAVLNGLPLNHREYVYQRFWLGMTDAEIAAHRGSQRYLVTNTWNRTIKPALQRELAHLR